VADQIREFFDSDRNRAVIADLREYVDPEPAETAGGDELAGLTVVFTGSLDRPRDELADLVERHGGNATGSVSGNTDYLVVGENPGTTKRADADDEDVPELSPAEFRDLLEERGVAVE
jgi:DNA ligase (NAD+)